MSMFSPRKQASLESALGLLVTTNLEVLAALDAVHAGPLAVGALQPQHNLLGGLGLLVEDGLGLTAVSGLLAVVAALTLGIHGSLARLVLGDLVLGVLLAWLAEGLLHLGDVHHLAACFCPKWKLFGREESRKAGNLFRRSECPVGRESAN